MKVKLSVLITCILLLSACAGTYYSPCGCGYTCTQVPPPYPSCQCTDIACNGKNPCLDPAKCCRVFGNIGGIYVY